MRQAESQMELNTLSDGVYELPSDTFNVYIVSSGCYFMLSRNHYNVVIKELGIDSDATKLVQLKQGGFSTQDIIQLKRSGII